MSDLTEPTTERWLLVRAALDHNIRRRGGLQPLLDVLESSEDEQERDLAARMREYRLVLDNLPSGVTWGECNSCGRGMFVRETVKSSACALKSGCKGRIIPAKRTPKK